MKKIRQLNMFIFLRMVLSVYPKFYCGLSVYAPQWNPIIVFWFFCIRPYPFAFAQFHALGLEKNQAGCYPHCATYSAISLYKTYREPYFFISTNTFFGSFGFPGPNGVGRNCPCTANHPSASDPGNENVIRGRGAELCVLEIWVIGFCRYDVERGTIMWIHANA